ncbi:diheme cytochrome c [Sulfurospirillum sp. 1612]|uniref:diheme cytochrome c n=1 Tax=Sulfurospirillum sp. 1612 TaxID=3094835 RepID=UPI002F9481B5
MKKVVWSGILLSSLLCAAGVQPVHDSTYIKECGSCHFAFQPGLLPQRSWKKIMNNLENHFDTDASLDEKSRSYLLKYMVTHSSNHAMEYKRSRKITYSIAPNQTPIQVTKTPYFIRKHRRIKPRMITQKEVGSISNCTACHAGAKSGDYGEHAVKIPNYRNYDD